MQMSRQTIRQMSKQTIRQRLAGRFIAEMPDVILSGDRCASVRGCRRILAYSPEEVVLALRERVVRLSGEGLRCVSFSGGCVTVEGKIASVSLGGKGKKA